MTFPKSEIALGLTIYLFFRVANNCYVLFLSRFSSLFKTHSFGPRLDYVLRRSSTYRSEPVLFSIFSSLRFLLPNLRIPYILLGLNRPSSLFRRKYCSRRIYLLQRYPSPPLFEDFRFLTKHESNATHKHAHACLYVYI